MEEILLCKPCAEGMKADYDLKAKCDKAVKETCCQCGKRRFCSHFTVIGEKSHGRGGKA